MDAKLAIALALSFVPGEATTAATTPTIAARADLCDCRNCKCGIACDCADSVVNTKTAKSVVKQSPPVVKQSLATRSPVGHTHTCKNGHTWDHSVTASHNCPFCGAYQNVQDRISRPVTTAKAATPPWIASPPPVTMSLTTLQSSVSAGGCANGQCSNVSRGGFFRWR